MFTLPIIGQLFFDGLATGLVFVILAAGLVLIISVSRILFIAYGQFYMVGAYMGWIAMNVFSLPFFPSLLIGTLTTAALGLLIWVAIFQHVEQGPGRFLSTIIIAMGLQLVIAQVGLNLSGTLPRSMPAIFPGTINFFDVVIARDKLFLISAGIASTLILFWVYEKTRIGRSMRAVAFNPEAAALQGVNINRTYLITMGIGAGLAGFAGGVISPSYGINPGMGSTILLSVLLMTMLGGMGSLLGALVGGLTVGLILSYGQFYVGGIVQIILFIIIGIIIFFRPGGLVGRVIDVGV